MSYHERSAVEQWRRRAALAMFMNHPRSVAEDFGELRQKLGPHCRHLVGARPEGTLLHDLIKDLQPGVPGSMPALYAIAKRLRLDGLDLEALDHHGSTALHLAIERRHSDFVEALSRAGSDIEAANAEGLIPFLACSKQGLVAACSHFLERGAHWLHAAPDGRNAWDLLRASDLADPGEVAELYRRVSSAHVADETRR